MMLPMRRASLPGCVPSLLGLISSCQFLCICLYLQIRRLKSASVRRAKRANVVRPGRDLKARQTRRRFGGRTPLCGTGVMSRIAVTVKPTVWSARSADSRPEPGPFTSTSSVRMPCSMAFLPADSAAICAAYGVDLREPLKSALPDDAQAIALPCASVMVMIVLLNDAFTCATPDVMFLRSLRRSRCAVVGFAMDPREL